jgi:hypothetical protein
MKRKLLSRNKARLSEHFRREAVRAIPPNFDASRLTFDSISQIKQFGQQCHQNRLARQQKLNPRQLKKLRIKQQRSGLIIGSKFGGMCKTKLKPAAAIFKSSPSNG